MANNKYSAAAASAMTTLNSLATRKNRPPHIPTVLSESALMDKETNAIYWQGGADIFSSSVTTPYLTQRGVLHIKATVLTLALWLWIWGKVARYLAARYFGPTSDGGEVPGRTLFLPPVLRKLATLATPMLQFCLLLCHALLYLRLPPFSPKVVAVTIALYLLEAYSCGTRRYLSHAMNAPAEVEAYLEQLRGVEPRVTWKVRCFHYENRELFKSFRGVWRIWDLLRRASEVEEGGTSTGAKLGENSASSDQAFVASPPSWMARKVVTHEAQGAYKFGSWEDQTVASLWKRAHSFSSTAHEAPFSKMTVSKLLVLADKEAREEYFAQQAAFVMLEGRKDVHAEFATSIEVDGFRPKLLAVRPVRRASHLSSALFRQHVYVLFTLLGLSLPYRIWFAKHCDEVRVTVVKETRTEAPKAEEDASGTKSSWFRGKWTRGSSLSVAAMDRQRAQELFRRRMQSFSLYEETPSPNSASLAKEDTLLTEPSPETIIGSCAEKNGEDTQDATTSDIGSTCVVNNSLDESLETENVDDASVRTVAPPESPASASLSTPPPPELPTPPKQDAEVE